MELDKTRVITTSSIRRLLPIAVPVLFVVAAYVLGYLTADQKLFPDEYVQSAKQLVRENLTAASPLPTGTRSLSTTFLRLRLDEIAVPVSRAGSGGGLSSFGDDVLLLTHDGAIFVVSGDQMRRTGIRVPDNNIDAYMAAVEKLPAGEYEHNFGWFRYNDILYFSDGLRAGLVVSYTEWRPGQECYDTAVGLLPLSPSDDSVEEIGMKSDHWNIVYRTEPCLPLKTEFRAIEGHVAGGRIAYLHPGKILLGSGDYHWDGVYAPEALAQADTNDYGKVLEIDLDSRTARHVSKGHRNIQGLLIAKSGEIWAVEQGPRGGDELNRIVEGNNYGWPNATLGTRYNGLPWVAAEQYGRHDSFDPPVYAWVPSVATSGITEIDGFDSSWDGDLLVASLRGESLFRLRVKDGAVVFSEPIPIGQRIRYVHQHTDGRILLWTDSQRLILVSKDETTLTHEFIDEIIVRLDLGSAREARLRETIEGCAECHSFDSGQSVGSPSLVDVFNRPIASSPSGGYSDALMAQGGEWSANELARYLKAPDEYAPGTTMPDPHLSKQEIADLIEVLKGLGAAE